MGFFDRFKVEKAIRQPPSQSTPVDEMKELGVAGAEISSGFVHDEFIVRLIGERGRRIYREMRDNDDTVGAILFAVEMLLRAVEWEVTSDLIEGDMDQTGGDEQTTMNINTPEMAVRFVEGVLFEDMDHTFDDFLGNVLSMLTFGWQYTEIVWKRRDGIQDEMSETPSSIFKDGMIGIHKLADRSQETLERWDVDEHGRVFGMWQEPPTGSGGISGGDRYIPISKALLFRPKQHKGSPEGRSVLRNAYRSWYFLKNIQEIEAIAIERELAGLPVIRIPNAILAGNTPEAIRAKNRYIQMARDIKFNEQGGAVIPSDPYYDQEGNPTGTPQVELTLVSASGSRAIDTDKVIKRYQAGIARSILADFIMMGQSERGSFSLSKNKTDLFLRAIEGWLGSIEETINRHLIPKLWRINGLDPQFMPKVNHGRIAPVNLDELGKFLKDATGSGFALNDPETEEFLRDVSGLPQGEGMAGEDEVIFDEGGEEAV